MEQVYLPVPTHSRFHDLSGKQYHFLNVIGLVGFKWRNAVWHCMCRCGKETDVKAGNLVSGKTKSCGCHKSEVCSARHKTHGHSYANHKEQTAAYCAWCNMKTRCLNANRRCHARYGGRGISICPQWVESFESFLRDMGEPPKGCTLDRINNDGDYEPGNCRWSTMQEQANNTRRSRHVTIEGERMTAMQAANKYGVSPFTIYGRLNRGKVNEEAVFGKAGR